MGTNPLLKQRRWQFSLKTLRLVLLVGALCWAWWREWQHYSNRKSLQADLAYLEASAAYNERLGRVACALDPQNPEHVKVLSALKCLNPFSTYPSEEISFETAAGRYCVVSLGEGMFSVPGTQVSVVALLDGDVLLDSVLVQTWTRGGIHKVHLQEKDIDGFPTVIVDFGSLRPSDVYRVTRGGFKLQPQIATSARD